MLLLFPIFFLTAESLRLLPQNLRELREDGNRCSSSRKSIYSPHKCISQVSSLSNSLFFLSVLMFLLSSLFSLCISAGTRLQAPGFLYSFFLFSLNYDVNTSKNLDLFGSQDFRNRFKKSLMTSLDRGGYSPPLSTKTRAFARDGPRNRILGTGLV